MCLTLFFLIFTLLYILGNALHFGFDGGTEGAFAVGRLRQTLDGRGRFAPEARTSRGRHQRFGRTRQNGGATFPALPRDGSYWRIWSV